MKSNKKKVISVLTEVSRKAGKAIVDYRMIESGDKIGVAVSGGKDSLSLLHVLRDRQRISPVPFEFEAIHVDFEFADFDPEELIEYLNQHGFSHRIERSDYLEGQKYEDIDCYNWSKNRRKVLFQLAKEREYTKLAFGHHLDDIVETILLNQFFRGEIAAMKPNQELFEGRVAIIRPLTYVREEAMVRLAKELGVDGMGQSKCAYDDTSLRMKIKSMLHDLEVDHPAVVSNIFKSLQNIKTDYLP